MSVRREAAANRKLPQAGNRGRQEAVQTETDEVEHGQDRQERTDQLPL